MTILGPGSVGEGSVFSNIPVAAQAAFVPSADLLAPNPNSLDAFSYHFYGAVSDRCGGLGADVAVIEDVLSPSWLDRTLADHEFYSALRDQYEPGKSIWLTETAQAACGGSPWASSFADIFRYINQQGALAQRGIHVVMHNTLAASDYALVDEDTLEPRPNYWAAVLWRRTMGSTVLAPPTSPATDMRIYAHCLPGEEGGVGLVALNLGNEGRSITLGHKAEIYQMTASELDAQVVLINGAKPSMQDDGAIIGLKPMLVREVTLAPQSITFIGATNSRNPSCGF